MITAQPSPARYVRPLIQGLSLAACAAAIAGCSQTGPDQLSGRDAKYALEVLERAPDHGFPAGAFNVEAIRAAQASKDPQADALLKEAVVAYAQAQHGLAIPRNDWPEAWGQRAAPYNGESELNAALEGGRFRQWLDDQAPKEATYVALQKAYAAARSSDNSAAAATLRANLERLRWAPRDVPATRVDVNIASATMSYIVDGQPKLSMKTASGKPGDETPILTSKIDSVVLNPPWNVPEGIAANELIPKGSAYLESHGFTTTAEGRLVQKPGPGNSLGLVKFDFDNPYAVYLHDTPAKAAFDREGRAVSHGCVRLEHAIDLANLLVGQQAGWSAERIQKVIAGGETTRVKLDAPVTVRLMYLTAVPAAAGVEFVPDVYGWDAAVVTRLDRALQPARRG